MPAAALIAPVMAIGFTGFSAATAGITAMATIMSAVGAVGATLGAIGSLTGVKELQIAGTVLGAVGAIGGLASSAGIFGATGSGFAATEVAGAAAGAATGEVASNVTNLAADGINAVAGPTGGYTLEALANSGLEGGIAGFGEAGGAGMSNVDIIDLVNGVGDSNFNSLAPAEQILDAQMVSPAAEALPETAVSAAPQEAVLPDLAQAEPPGLIDSAGLPDAATNAAVDPSQVGADGIPRDPYGNLIAQGGGDPGAGQLGAGTSNPAASASPTTAAPADPAAGATPSAARPGPVAESATPTPAIKVTGTPAEANISGFPAGAGPQGPSGGATAPTPGVASPTVAVTGENGVWGKILDFVENRPTLALGALMGASSFISGAFKETTTAQQRAAYSAQAEQNLAAANLANSQNELLQRRLRNLNEIPVARPIQPPPGLINSAVTGTPA